MGRHGWSYIENAEESNCQTRMEDGSIWESQFTFLKKTRGVDEWGGGHEATPNGA